MTLRCQNAFSCLTLRNEGLLFHSRLGTQGSGYIVQIPNFISLISEYGIIEMARSGRTAISQKPGTMEDSRNA